MAWTPNAVLGSNDATLEVLAGRDGAAVWRPSGRPSFGCGCDGFAPLATNYDVAGLCGHSCPALAEVRGDSADFLDVAAGRECAID